MGVQHRAHFPVRLLEQAVVHAHVLGGADHFQGGHVLFLIADAGQADAAGFVAEHFLGLRVHVFLAHPVDAVAALQVGEAVFRVAGVDGVAHAEHHPAVLSADQVGGGENLVAVHHQGVLQVALDGAHGNRGDGAVAVHFTDAGGQLDGAVGEFGALHVIPVNRQARLAILPE